MKITIKFDCSNAAFDDDPMTEISRILQTCIGKIERQLQRSDGCICTAPEADDKLLDINGNTIGEIICVHPEPEDDFPVTEIGSLRGCMFIDENILPGISTLRKKERK